MSGRNDEKALAILIGLVAAAIAIVAFATRGALAPEPAAAADARDVSGTWRGVLTQPGAAVPRFGYELDLRQDGTRVEGTATLTSPPPHGYSVTMVVRGSVSGGVLRLHDVLTTASEAPADWTWCRKRLELSASGRHTLTGGWGERGCGSGTVSLSRR